MNLTRSQLKHPTQLYREVKSSFVKKLGLLHAPPPLFAKIETTRRCNLNCVVCFRHSFPGPVKPDMDPHDFINILDKLPKAHTIALHGYGEPLVHKDFMNFCNAVWNYGKKILLVTNGTLLDNYTIEKLMRFEGVQMISFSIDTFHAHGYRGDYYADLARIIKRTVKARRLYGSHAKIIIHSTFNIDNVHTMPDMIEFADKTGVDTISLQDITSLYEFGDSTSEKSIRTQTVRGKYHKIHAEEKALELGVNAQFHLEEQNRCHWLWRSIYIDIEGNVYPCTDTLNYPFGNIFTDDFNEIWNGPKARIFRRKWLHDPVDECMKCISRRR